MGVTVTHSFSPGKWTETDHRWGDTQYTWGTWGENFYALLDEEEIAFSDLIVKLRMLDVQELLVISDTIADKSVSKFLSEMVATHETYWDVILFHIKVVESLSISGDRTDRFSKNVLRNIRFDESRRIGISYLREFFDGLRITPHLSNAVGSFKSESAVSILDYDTQKTQKNISGGLYINELAGKHIKKPIDYGFSITDGYSRNVDFFRQLEEQFAVLEEYRKTMAFPVWEQLHVGSELSNTYGLVEQENVGFAGSFSRTWQTHKELTDVIAVSEKLSKTPRKKLFDNFSAYDDILQASGQVLNNIIVSHGAMDLSKFMELSGKSPGYSKFVEFKVGEYDYKDALVMLKVSCMVEQSKPSINNLIMHVDIPDTDDRGTAKIASTTAATRVRFNQPYYDPPEVSVVLRTGNTESGILTPYVVNVTNEYFDVELRNQNMELATGTISWVSKGY